MEVRVRMEAWMRIRQQEGKVKHELRHFYLFRNTHEPPTTHTHTHSAGYCRYDNEQNHEWSLPPRGVGLPPLEGIYFKRHSFLKRAERNGQPGKM